MGPLNRRRVLLGGACLAGACATGVEQQPDIAVETFNVWPGDPPGSDRVTAKQEIIERSTNPATHDRAVIHVRTPTLKVFKPREPNGAAVLICPGGAYQRVVLDKEGDETAERLARAGVTTAVLIYRLPEDGWTAGWQAPLQDAHRAIRLIRAGRVAPGIDPRRVGVLGFSAGGHLAATVALRRLVATYPPKDDADRQPFTVNFAALIYAAYLDGTGSAALRAGPRMSAAPDLFAMVNANAPPTFLLHAADDATVPAANSVRMYQALQGAGVRSELHIYPEGGHGFGIARASGKPVEAWPNLLLAWLMSLPPDARPPEVVN